MAARYPSTFLTTTQLPTSRADTTPTTTSHKDDHDQAAFELIAIEKELGLTPGTDWGQQTNDPLNTSSAPSPQTNMWSGDAASPSTYRTLHSRLNIMANRPDLSVAHAQPGSTLVAAPYDIMCADTAITATNNRLGLAAVYVDYNVTVGHVFAAITAAITSGGGGNFNGTCLYRYDYNAGSEQLVLIARTTNAFANNQGTVANGGFYGNLTTTQAGETLTLVPGLYYLGHAYSDDATGTRAKYTQANVVSTALENLEFDSAAYPMGRLLSFTLVASTPPTSIAKASLLKVSNVPWMCLLT